MTAPRVMTKTKSAVSFDKKLPVENSSFSLGCNETDFGFLKRPKSEGGVLIPSRDHNFFLPFWSEVHWN